MLVDEILLNLKTAYDSGTIKKLLADLDQAGKTVSVFVQKMESGFKRIVDGFGSWRGELTQFTSGFDKLAGKASGWLKTLDGESANTMQSFISMAEGALASAGIHADGVGKHLEEVGQHVETLMTVFQVGQAGFALLMSPITWVVAVIALVIFLVNDLMTYLNGGESVLGSFWDPFIEVAREIIPLMQDVVNAWLSLWEIVGPVLIESMTTIWTLVKTVVGGIVDFVVKRWDVIKSAFAGAFQAIKGILQIFVGAYRLVMSLITGDTEATGQAIEQIWEGVKNFFVGIGNFILSVFELLADASMAVLALIVDWLIGEWEKVVNFFSSLGEVILSACAAIGPAVMAIMAVIVERLLGLWDGFRERFSNIWKGLGEAVSNVFAGIGTACSETVASILEQFKPVTDLFSSIGNTISGFFGGDKSDVNAISGAVLGQFGEVAGRGMMTLGKTVGGGASNAFAPTGYAAGKSVSLAQNSTNQFNITGSDSETIARVVAREMIRVNRIATQNAGSLIGV